MSVENNDHEYIVIKKSESPILLFFDIFLCGE